MLGGIGVEKFFPVEKLHGSWWTWGC